MLIQSLEQKTRLALMTVLLTIVGNVIICGMLVFFGANLISEERKQVYVLDGDIPFLAQRTKEEANFIMEAKADIQLFHQYFFNLPPDDSYINWSLGKALYMADGSALKQKQAMTESGFFNDIVSSSSNCTIMCDSIKLDKKKMTFTYYGRQRIERRTSILYRQLITSGGLKRVPRTENNPHGLLIINWRTLVNKDLSEEQKSQY